MRIGDRPKGAEYSVTLFLVSALWQRLEQVMEMRDLNPSSWATLAQVPRATVRLAIKEKRESMESRTLAALASVANVSLEWLATGSFGPSIPEDSRYPSRPRAIAAAHLVGYSEAAIASVAAIDNLPSDPGVRYWLALLEAKDLEHVEPAAPRLPVPADEHRS